MSTTILHLTPAEAFVLRAPRLAPARTTRRPRPAPSIRIPARSENRALLRQLRRAEARQWDEQAVTARPPARLSPPAPDRAGAWLLLLLGMAAAAAFWGNGEAQAHFHSGWENLTAVVAQVLR